MDFAIAKYAVLPGDTTSVFCFPQDSANAGHVRDAVLRSIRLFSDWFGPTMDPPRFSVIEVPNGWGSQKDVTCILQSAAAFEDRRRLYEVYHEVSHMWGVTSRDSFPARIEEGLATYLEDAAAERLEQADGRVQRTHAALVPWLRDLLEREPRYRDLPMREFGVRGDTDLSYSVGFLMFEVLHALVGDRAFGDIIGGFHRRYHASGATAAQFLAHAKERSPVDLTRFFEDWYATTAWQRYVREDMPLERIVAAYRRAGDGR
jgi:aminopeptidase N